MFHTRDIVGYFDRFPFNDSKKWPEKCIHWTYEAVNETGKVIYLVKARYNFVVHAFAFAFVVVAWGVSKILVKKTNALWFPFYLYTLCL